MIQDLGGVDIYHCPYFEVESSGKLKFIRGRFYDRTPDTFNKISEINDILRYCIWIIRKEEHLSITKYAAVVFMNRVNQRLQRIEVDFKKMLKKEQGVDEKSLKKSIDKPGRTYV